MLCDGGVARQEIHAACYSLTPLVLQAAALRDEQYDIEDDLIEKRDSSLAERQRRAKEIIKTNLLWVKHTETG
jgi:hypothetical protein